MKKFQCDNCGAALTIDEDELTAVCEYCGTTVNLLDEHPEYSEAIIDKQIEELSKPDEVSNVSKMTLWKLILTILTGMIIVSAAVAIFCEAVFYSDPYDKPAYTEAGSADFSWPATGLSAVLPEPPTGYGMVASDSDVHFSADVFEVSQQDFDTYVTMCRKEGFDIAAEGTDSSFYAYNADGYCIDLFYWEEYEELNIYLDAPEEITEFIWPTTGLAAVLPEPVSDYGRIISEDAEQVSILVYVESKTEFDQYVEACKKHGFTENHEFYFMDNRNGWYEADHRNGYHLNLDYSDNYYKKMEIWLEK